MKTVLLLLSVLLFFTDSALAARTINSVTVDGVSSTTVSGGATISAVVNVSTTGNGANGRWRSTGWLIAGSSGTLTCEDHANYESSSGNFSETFNITAPAIDGVYNLYLVAYRKDDCTQGDSAEFISSNALTVGATMLSVSIESVSQAYDVSSYGGSSQDRTGTVAIQDSGLSLFLEGNRWQKIDFPYTVTADTVIEFDFQSTVQGEINGLGFDNDLSISSNRSFRVYGTQNWGISDFATYPGSGSTHFTIPVGQFYTGVFQYLFFINDDDSNPTGNSLYSNIVVYEDTAPIPVAQYEMEEASWGSVIDSINGINGVAFNGADTVGSSCRYGQFDGVNDYVQIPHDARLNGSDALTYVALVRADSWSGVTQIMAKSVHGGGSGRAQMGMFSEGGVFKGRAETVAGRKEITMPLPLTAGDWDQLALVFSGTALTLYKNGIAQASTSFAATTLRQTTDPLNISKRVGSNTYYFDGLIDDVRVYTNALTAQEILDLYNSVTPCPLTVVDHYEIVHDGQGLTCDAERVTINACANGSCSNLSTDSVTLDFLANGAIIGSPTFTGSTTVSFSNTVVETLTLSIANPSLTAPNPLVCDDGSGTSCDIAFSDAGFVFYANGVSNDIETQLSGKASNIAPGAQSLSVKAVKSSAADPGVCEALISNASADIGIAYQCINPNSCAISNDALTINATTIDADTVSPYTEVSLVFNSAGEATFTLNYADAGEIALAANAELAVSGSVGTANVQGDSNSFVVKPASFEIAPENLITATGPTDPNIYTTAGTNFNIIVIAKNSNGITTPNYGNEITPETIKLTHALNQPDPGEAGTFTSSLTKIGNGIFSGTANWDEVGIIDLTADVGDEDYLVTGNVTSTLTDVGRFIPASLLIIPINQGIFTSANFIGIAPFTYVGQLFSYDTSNRPSFRVTALNALSPAKITMNYTGAWGKLSAGSIAFTEPTSDAIQDGTTTATKMALDFTLGSDGFHDPATNLSPVAVNGIFNVTFTNDEFTYIKDSNSQISPFNPSVNLLITNVIDGDGISTGAITLNPTGIEPIRFGRMRMYNANGSELSPLVMDYRLEYFDSGNWLLHDDMDSMIVIGDITSAPTGFTTANLIEPVTPPIVGKFGITLSPPGAGNDGAYVITTDVFNSGEPWLQYDWDSGGNFDDNPFATASFGIYKGNPVLIYIQQTYQ